MVLSILLVSLLAISAVSASDNTTSDVIGVEETMNGYIAMKNDDHIIINNVNDTFVANEYQSYNVIEFESQNNGIIDEIRHNDFINNINGSDDNCGAFERNNELLSNGNDNVLGDSPSANRYSVRISDTTLAYKESGYVHIGISPVTQSNSYDNKYDFYFKVYDSKGTEMVNNRFGGTEDKYYIRFDIGAYKLSTGVYTMKIINYKDKQIMDTAKLTIITVPKFAYSVSVFDTTIDYGSTGSITMDISPASNYYYKYDFYLKVYDSNGIEKISKRYYSSSSNSIESYRITSNNLAIGVYDIKILDSTDNSIVNSAKLTISSPYPPYSAYSVNVLDMVVDYDKEALIEMSITPAYTYTYKYDFYLKVYDSNGVEKISKRYYTTGFLYSETYNVGANTLYPGIYTILIMNRDDNELMSTATLTVKKTSKLNVNNVTTDYNGGKYLLVTLTDSLGNAISGATLTVNLDGVKTINTDSNGQAKLSTNGLAPKTYTATITFDGNNNYDNSTVTAKIIVKKATPTLTAKAKTFKKSVKTKKYTVTLKTNQNKVMKNTKLTLKVNKKTYTAKTNAKGQATFKITKLTKKGTFKATITYKGSAYYNKVTKNINIKCK